jgi:hypothetical protein
MLCSYYSQGTHSSSPSILHLGLFGIMRLVLEYEHVRTHFIRFQDDFRNERRKTRLESIETAVYLFYF